MYIKNLKWNSFCARNLSEQYNLMRKIKIKLKRFVANIILELDCT